MGRGKVDLEYIKDSKKRSGVFFNRRAGLLKKAVELSTLCGTDVAVLLTDLKGHLHCFRSTPELDFVVSSQKLNERLLKADKRLFRYSEEDYPFKKVHLMRGRGKINVEQLETSLEARSQILGGGGEGLLRKRGISSVRTKEGLSRRNGGTRALRTSIESLGSSQCEIDQKGTDCADNGTRRTKRLKIAPDQTKTSRNQLTKLETKNDSKFPKIGNPLNLLEEKPRQWLQEEDPPEIYLYEHYHKVDLSKAISRLQNKTHTFYHFFKAQRARFLRKLINFHRFSNAYGNSECDEYMLDMFVYRLLVSLYFSEVDFPVSKQLRDIQLTQFNCFLGLIELKKGKSTVFFIEQFRRYLNVILQVISAKITPGRYFSFKRHLKSFKNPLKTKAFYKILLKKYSIWKVVNILRMQYNRLSKDQTVHQGLQKPESTQEISPKKFKFNISNMVVADTQMLEIIPKIPEVMGYITLAEDMIYNILNEIRFYGEAVNLDKKCLEALGKELYDKIDRYEDAMMGLSIEDSGKVDQVALEWGLAGNGAPGGDCLIDLRSRMAGSIGVGSAAKFSWEGL